MTRLTGETAFTTVEGIEDLDDNTSFKLSSAETTPGTVGAESDVIVVDVEEAGVVIHCCGISVANRETVKEIADDVVFGVSEDPVVTNVETGCTFEPLTLAVLGGRLGNLANKALRRDDRRDNLVTGGVVLEVPVVVSPEFVSVAVSLRGVDVTDCSTLEDVVCCVVTAAGCTLSGIKGVVDTDEGDIFGLSSDDIISISLGLLRLITGDLAIKRGSLKCLITSLPRDVPGRRLQNGESKTAGCVCTQGGDLKTDKVLGDSMSSLSFAFSLSLSEVSILTFPLGLRSVLVSETFLIC